jgi:hypothetical protein
MRCCARVSAPGTAPTGLDSDVTGPEPAAAAAAAAAAASFSLRDAPPTAARARRRSCRNAHTSEFSSGTTADAGSGADMAAASAARGGLARAAFAEET